VAFAALSLAVDVEPALFLIAVVALVAGFVWLVRHHPLCAWFVLSFVEGLTGSRSAYRRRWCGRCAAAFLAFTLRELLEWPSNKSLTTRRSETGRRVSPPLENAVRQAADRVLAEAKPTDDGLAALREAFRSHRLLQRRGVDRQLPHALASRRKDRVGDRGDDRRGSGFAHPARRLGTLDDVDLDRRRFVYAQQKLACSTRPSLSVIAP
jgi:hypothetical protein